MTYAAHATTIALSEPAPPEVAIGAEVVVRLKVSCSQGCDLRGLPIRIAPPDGDAATYELARFEAGINETMEVALKAPEQVGEHIWNVTFPLHERNDIAHQECALPIAIKTRPHGSSMAVWDIPLAVVTGETFEIKLGAKSTAAHELAGSAVEVCDQTGAIAGCGKLNPAPLEGSSALYWTEIELRAPSSEGLSTWVARFAATDAKSAHDGAACEFIVTTVRRPEHTLSVTVVEKDTATPVEDAIVRLGGFRASTDAAGLARVRMPKGRHELVVWKVGYEAPALAVDITGDAAIQVEVVVVHEPNPDDAWRA